MFEDDDELPPKQEPNFKRAPKAYRELLNKVGEAIYFKHRSTPMQGKIEAIEEIGGLNYSFVVVFGWGAGWSRGPSLGTFDKIIVRSKHTAYDDRWYAYWIRGNGTRVFGNYENFEKEVLLFNILWV